jgi:hypothetical protein
VKPQDLISLAGPAIAGLIAVGTTPRSGFLNYDAWSNTVEKATAVAAELGADAQLDLLNAILGLTFAKEGAGPFLEKVKVLMGSLGAPVEPDTSTPPNDLSSLTMMAPLGKQNGQKPSPSKSHEPSRSAFTVDIPPRNVMRGATLPDSLTRG